MREIRPYGSEEGGGETLPTPILRPGLWPLNQNPLKYQNIMVLQDGIYNPMPSSGAQYKYPPIILIH